MKFRGGVVMLVKDNFGCVHLYIKKSYSINSFEKYRDYVLKVKEQEKNNLLRAYIFQESDKGYEYLWGTEPFRKNLGEELGHNEKKYITYLQENRPDVLLRGPYKSKKTKALHLCKQGHEFLQTPSAIMEGKKCPKCKILTRESKGSKYITELLSLNNVEFVKEVSMKNLGYEGERRLDFLVVDNNLPMFAIEFHGIQHYKKIRNSFFGGIEGHRSRVERDRIKKGQCWNLGIPLIEIPYTESEDEIRFTVEYFLNVYGLDKRKC